MSRYNEFKREIKIQDNFSIDGKYCVDDYIQFELNQKINIFNTDFIVTSIDVFINGNILNVEYSLIKIIKAAI